MAGESACFAPELLTNGNWVKTSGLSGLECKKISGAASGVQQWAVCRAVIDQK